MNENEKQRVLIAGGGVAALEAALALRALAADNLSVELVAPEEHFRYRPLAVAEPFGLGAVRNFELAALAAEAGASYTTGELVSVDVDRHLAYTSPAGPLPYSRLLLACGAVPKPAVEGAITFRGRGDMKRIEHLLAEIEAGDVGTVVFAVPVGAVRSLPAYELALMTASWISSRRVAEVTVALVTPETEPVELFGSRARDAVGQLLEDRGIVFTRARSRSRRATASSCSSATASWWPIESSPFRSFTARGSVGFHRRSRASSPPTSTGA